MKKILCGVFLSFLAVLFVLSSVTFVSKDILTISNGYGGGLKGIILTLLDRTSLEDALNKSVAFHDYWIDLYGGVANKAGVDVFLCSDNDDVYVDKNNRATFINSEKTIFNESELQGIHTLSESADKVGAQKLFVSVPQKFCPMETKFRCRGVCDYTDENTAYIMDAFRDEGFNVLDLHERIHAQNRNHTDMYLATDHHWKISAGLWGAKEVATLLRLDTTQMAPELYSEKKYDKILLGSVGRRTGRLFSAPEDLCIPVPTFDNEFSIAVDHGETKTGKFEDIFLYESHTTKDVYNNFAYSTLLDGDKGYVDIHNLKMPQGKRILIVKDSFINALAPYLATACEELILLDPRHNESALSECILEAEPDIVIASISVHQASNVFNFS